MVNKYALQASIITLISGIIVIIANNFNLDLNIYFIGVGAIVCIDQTKVGIKRGLGRVYGSLSGAIFAIISLYLLRYFPSPLTYIILACISVYILVIIQSYIRNELGGLEALVVYLTMLTHNPNNEILIYALSRVGETILGCIIGISVNYLVTRNVSKK